MTGGHFWVFAFTALLLNLTPGNDMLYVMARSTSQGSKAGIVSSLGVMAGCMVHMVAAAAGLSAIIAKSATAFDIIKYIGAAYLIYLGVQSLLEKKNSLKINFAMPKLSYQKIFWQGVITNVLNPKVALFFLAFLPQFINVREGNYVIQILFLGIWFDVGGTIVNIIVSLLFGKIGKWMQKSSSFIQWQKRITGSILIALGIKVALSSPK
ncbi:MAG TPA: LysE family translocator [Puia sp.]|jgi:threonine/homoserine/homoserine lactone efflux protein|nr:LysE family translocator [Puia sp.]